MLQHKANVDAQAQGQIQHAQSLAQSSVDALHEREKAIRACAEANYQAKEEENKKIRAEIAVLKEEQAKKTANIPDLDRTEHGPYHSGLVEEADQPENVGGVLNGLSRVVTAVTEGVSSVLRTKPPASIRSSPCPSLDASKCFICQKKGVKTCKRCSEACCEHHYESNLQLCTKCAGKAPMKFGADDHERFDSLPLPSSFGPRKAK